MTPLRTFIGGAVLLLTASLGLAAPASASPSASASGPTESAQPAKPAGESRDASAQCAHDFNAPGVNIRALPETGGAIRGQGNPGDCADYHGAISGQNTYCPEGSMWTDQWYDVTNVRTGARGWVLMCYISRAFVEQGVSGYFHDQSQGVMERAGL